MIRSTLPFSLFPSENMVEVFFLYTVAALLMVRALFFNLYQVLVKEDGLLENIQAGLYFGAGWLLWLSLLALLRKKQTFLALFFSGLSLCLIVIAFEEISWGQRLLGFNTTPFFAQHNVQQEVTIHNLSFFQRYLHVGYAILGLVLGAGLPLVKIGLLHRRTQFSRLEEVLAFFPSWKLAGYFLAVSFVYLGILMFPPLTVIGGQNQWGMIWRDQEAGELLLAMGMLCWALMVRRKTLVSKQL